MSAATRARAIEELAICVDEDATTAERIRGVVRGKVGRAVRCEAVTLALVQRGSYPYGFRELRAERARQELAGEVAWPVGHEVALPFELAAPGFPPSYQGTLVSVSWALELTVRMAGEVDQTCRQEVPVELGPDAGVAVVAPLPERAVVERVSARPAWIAAGAVGVTLALAIVGFAGGSWLAWPALAALAISVFALLGLVVQWQNERRMGNVQLGFETDAAGDVWCVLWARRDAPAADVRVDLVAVEVLYNDVRSQGDRKKREHTIARQTLALAAAAPGTYRAPLPPLAAPFTMTNGLGSGVAWHAQALVTAPPGIRLERRRALEVRPARGPGAVGRSPGS